MNPLFFISKLFSTFFFVGLAPKMPGTFGSLAATIVIFPFLNKLSFYDMQYIVYLSLLLGVITTNIYIENTKQNDPKEVVIDEALGVWSAIFLSIYFLPSLSKTYICIFCFILFRFFDIVKPFPISYIDKNIKNAFGVMLDDFLAGVFAAIVLIVMAKLIL